MMKAIYGLKWGNNENCTKSAKTFANYLINKTRNKSIDEALKEMGVKGIESFLNEITEEKGYKRMLQMSFVRQRIEGKCVQQSFKLI